jgi:hypothetical protein
MRLPLLPAWVRYLAVGVAILLIVLFSVVSLRAWVTDTGPLGLLPIRKYLHLIASTGLAIVLGYALANAGGAAVAVVLWRVLLRRV